MPFGIFCMCLSFLFLGQRDKGDFWYKWAQRDSHCHSIIHLWPHHEEVGVQFMWQFVNCVVEPLWLLYAHCASQCSCDIVDCAFSVHINYKALIREWLVFSEQLYSSGLAAAAVFLVCSIYCSIVHYSVFYLCYFFVCFFIIRPLDLRTS